MPLQSHEFQQSLHDDYVLQSHELLQSYFKVCGIEVKDMV
jgi:hypothetical protein